jgi:hypothetical protein
MKASVFLAADYANLSGDGKLNVMGIFNQILAPSFPARHSTFFLVAKLALELGESTSEEHDFQIKLVDEEGKEMEIGPPQKSKFPEPQQVGIMSEYTIILGIRDMIFPDPGLYKFVLLVDGQNKAEYFLSLALIEQVSA